jgi:macrolide transport system ATP-binding/permease protein
VREPLIELQNIERYYGEGDALVKAIDGVSLKIYAGEFVAIMGQSGSGKSTLMNLLGLLDRANTGAYLVNGQDTKYLKANDLAALRRDTFGFVFQRYNLLGTVNAADNVEIPALYAAMPAQKRKERSHALLSDLGLGDRASHRPNELSGGQQQRVAIARALMNDPPVILADEPTGALDSKSSEDVMMLLQDLHKQGRTVIVITHEEQVAAYAQRQIRIEDGKISHDDGAQNKNVDHPASRNHKNSAMAIGMWESIKMAFRSLRANMFRTALTLLGIIIGVAAVITMLAIGEGSKQNVLEQISAMGTNLLNVRPGAPGMRRGGDRTTLKISDADTIRQNIDNISYVVPMRSGSQTVRFGSIDDNISIEGVGADFPSARDWALTKGNFFNKQDIQSYTTAAVLGATAKQTFFPHNDDPIGEYLLIGNIPFEVIGVMEEKGTTPWGRDRDNVIWVPYTTGMMRLFGSTHLSGITLKVNNVAEIDETEEAVKNLLKDLHKAEDFSVRNSASYLEMATETQNTLTILLGAVAAISLFVGGIGVMNIMLVSVVERTREIGLRMATGARRFDIMLQFNTEAAVVCTVGGIIGVILGFAAGTTLTFFEVNIVFTAQPAILAFGSAVFTGILFGYLPARKAANLDPVVALGAE